MTINDEYTNSLRSYDEYLKNLESNFANNNQIDAKTINKELTKISGVIEGLVKINESIQSQTTTSLSRLRAIVNREDVKGIQEKAKELLNRASKLNGEYIQQTDKLADELHLPREELRQIVMRGDESIVELTSQQRQALEKYQEMLEKSDLSSKEGALSVQEVLKIIRIALTTKTSSPEGIGEVIAHPSFKRRIWLLREPSFRIDMEHSLLGGGTYGIVKKTQNIISQQFAAVKSLGHQVSKEVSQKEISKEIQNLNKIHKNGTVPGIQEKPFAVYYLEGQMYGYLGKLYDDDLSRIAKEGINKTGLEVKDRVDGCRQLLAGLKHLQDPDIGLFHGDIKPENILVKRNDSGELMFYIADFGGAIFYSKDNPLQELTEGYTPGYTSKRDLDEINKAVKDKNHERYKELQEKRDVYALGITLYTLLSDQKYFNFGGNEFSFNETDFKQKLIKKGFSEVNAAELADLIKKMTEPNIDERINITQAIQEFGSKF